MTLIKQLKEAHDQARTELLKDGQDGRHYWIGRANGIKRALDLAEELRGVDDLIPTLETERCEARSRALVVRKSFAKVYWAGYAVGVSQAKRLAEEWKREH